MRADNLSIIEPDATFWLSVPKPRTMAQSPKDRAFKVLQISDTHLHAAADSRMRGVTTYETFLAVLERAQHDARWPADVIVATGDIVQDESRAGYERFRVEPGAARRSRAVDTGQSR